MTGNNILTARFLRENSFEFKPQFKLFIDTNHLPQISDMTLFESDRIKIIPFNRHFTAEERDIDLKSFFAKPENLSGILNWCLEGFRLYMTEAAQLFDRLQYRNADHCAGRIESVRRSDCITGASCPFRGCQQAEDTS